MRKLQMLGVFLMLLLLVACQSAAPAVDVPGADVPTPAATEPAPAATPETADPAVDEAASPDAALAEETPEVEAPAATQPAAAVPAGGEAAEQVITALLSLSRLNSFRADQQVVMSDATISNTIEMNPPDRFRLSSEELDLIVIDQDAYVRADHEEWIEYPMGYLLARDYLYIPNDENLDEYLSIFSNARETGRDVLNGEPVIVYEFILGNPQDVENIQATLWVGADDGLPRQQTFQTTSPNPDDTVEITTVFRDFNEPFEIVAP
jgi:hypothetical protein